jgi:hypothetical protein
VHAKVNVQCTKLWDGPFFTSVPSTAELYCTSVGVGAAIYIIYIYFLFYLISDMV